MMTYDDYLRGWNSTPIRSLAYGRPVPHFTPTLLEPKKEPPKPTLTLIIGLPGAGKSTYVKQHYPLSQQNKRLVISMDDIRLMHGHFYNLSTEDSVTSILLKMVAHGLKNDMNVVVDESITTHSLAAKLVNIAQNRGCKIRIVELTTPVTACWNRRVRQAGFRREAFLEKFGEWLENREAILKLADEYVEATTETR